MGPIAKAIGDRNDRADTASRLKWKRGAKRQMKFGLVSGDRVLLKNTQVTAPTTAPSAPAMHEVTQTTGALLRIRSVETDEVKTVHSGNCNLRLRIIAVSDKEGEEAQQGDATALRLHATANEANVAVPQEDQSKPPTTVKMCGEAKKKNKEAH